MDFEQPLLIEKCKEEALSAPFLRYHSKLGINVGVYVTSLNMVQVKGEKAKKNMKIELKKATPLERYLTGYDAILILPKDIIYWDTEDIIIVIAHWLSNVNGYITKHGVKVYLKETDKRINPVVCEYYGKDNLYYHDIAEIIKNTKDKPLRRRKGRNMNELNDML